MPLLFHIFPLHVVAQSDCNLPKDPSDLRCASITLCLDSGRMGFNCFKFKCCITNCETCKWRPYFLQPTLPAEMFGRSDFWLKTRVIIKILTHSWYPRKFDQFSWGWKLFFEKKNPKWPTEKELSFSKSPILKIFFWKFHGLVLGSVELIDVKGIDVARPIWQWGCPM